VAVFSLDEVTVDRPDGSTGAPLLDGVRLDIGAGRCTVIVGPSGAGKSTLLRLLNRLEEPTAGRLLFSGAPIIGYDVLELRRRVGLVQQAPVLLAESVLEDLRIAVPQLSPEAASELLARVGLPADFLSRATGTLSGGEAQRVCLARAFALKPEVLLLDEPTSALDAFAAQSVEHVVLALLARGLTTVLVAHDLRQAERLADDVVVLIAGRVADAGPGQRVFAEPANAGARRFLAGVT
jgi:putative ABC transport system ATP-binding protein